MVSDVEAFARLGPQRLQRVHRAAVADHADHLAVGTGHRRAGRDRRRKPDRAAHVLQPVMRRRGRRRRKEAAAGGDGFIDHDGVFRDRHRDRLRDRGMGQRAGRFGELDQLLRLGVRPAWRRARRPAPPAPRPSSRRPTVMRWTSQPSGFSMARLVRIGKEGHRIVGLDQHDMLEVLQDRQRLLDHIGDPVDREPAAAARHARIDRSGPSPCSRSCRRSAPPAPAPARSARCR